MYEAYSSRKLCFVLYFNVTGFSISGNKQKIISEIKSMHKDTCPCITFIDMDGNKEFLNWIKESVD
jgi:hypothetical protein